MVRYRKRRNPARKKSRRKARRPRSRARRSRSRSRARRPRRSLGKRHRVTLYKSKRGWSRGRITRRSVMRGRGPIRVNPSRRRRRNPAITRGLIPTKGFVMQAGAIVGGFVVAKMLTPYYSQIPVVNMLGRYTPALNIAIGALAAKKLKGALKPVGIGIAASGVASLLAGFFPQLALSADLGMDLGDEGVVRVGDDVVRIAGDDGESESVYGGDSVYERI